MICKTKFVMNIILQFLISFCYCNENCGCNKIKRDFGTSQKNSVCFAPSLKVIIKQRLTYNMALIKGGDYFIGTNKPIITSDGEAPRRRIKVKPFYIDKYEVDNGAFAQFIEETNYVTDAEKFNNSFVFYSLVKNVHSDEVISSVAEVPWWFLVNRTNWKHPEGPNSFVRDRWDHPVIHVSWYDAVSFCNWLGKRLPTEAEWEIACKGNSENTVFPWGNSLTVKKKHKANIWQGSFPHNNTGNDGFINTAPVHNFEQNSYGIHNIIGNVWEWTSDWWSVEHSKITHMEKSKFGIDKVKKGGSYMCHKNYCYRYRCVARSHNTPDTTAGNLGFRCAKSKES